MRGDVLTIAGSLCCALSLLLMSIFDNFWPGVVCASCWACSQARCSSSARRVECRLHERSSRRVSGLYGAGYVQASRSDTCNSTVRGQIRDKLRVTSIYIAAVAIGSGFVARGSERYLKQRHPRACSSSYLALLCWSAWSLPMAWPISRDFGDA